jgi:hypothetical protein
MVEIMSRDEVSVHRDVAQTVDTVLRGAAARPERRNRNESGQLEITAPPPSRARELRRPAMRDVIVTMHPEVVAQEPPPLLAKAASPLPVPISAMARGRGSESKPIRIFAFGVSRNRLEQAINQTRIHATIVRDLREADIVLTLKNYFRQKPQPLRDAETRGISVYVLRANTIVQMENVLASLLPSPVAPIGSTADPRENGNSADVLGALEEAEQAITAVIEGGSPISLYPQESYIRKLQHQLADRYNLGSRSKGREPNRHVEIYRAGAN